MFNLIFRDIIDFGKRKNTTNEMQFTRLYFYYGLMDIANKQIEAM